MLSRKSIWSVAVPSPLRRVFDYWLPDGLTVVPRPGLRVEVPFAGRQLIGVLIRSQAGGSVTPDSKLKSIIKVLDDEALLGGTLFRLLAWSSGYYHHPMGEVFSAALPTLLRQGGELSYRGQRCWHLSDTGLDVDQESLKRAPKQRLLLTLLSEHGVLSDRQLNQYAKGWQPAMRSLREKALVEAEQRAEIHPMAAEELRELNAEQAVAVNDVLAGLSAFHPFLLNGVTGSGKTEVYLSIAEKVIEQGRQVLILVPEIGLTPQLVSRFQQRFAVPIALMHSGLNDQERLDSWLIARDGRAPLIIGTRSAVFSQIKNLGLIIVDEEHDASFKQQDGFRYSARDVAVMRARLEKVAIVLGSATPSLETLYNVAQGRYRELKLTQRAGGAKPPKIEALDVRGQYMEHGISNALITQMRQHLAKSGQVLLFLNRRGYSPTLLCHDCGWSAECQRCDSHMVLHQREQRLRCHHCGKDERMVRVCPQCKSEQLRSIGQGTERIEEALQHHFPEYGIVRIDRDSTRRKGSLQAMIDGIHDAKYQILLGTQMLAKGHHFPNVTLVGILDAEQGLYSADYRAMERMAQQVLQVSGRAGRAQRPGTVIIQTHHPEHPMLRELLEQGYTKFSTALMRERKETEMPPFTALALLRAESTDQALPQRFLSEVYQLAAAHALPDVLLLGPVPSPMERRAGRYRAQLLIQAPQRGALHRLLDLLLPQLEKSKLGRKVRWSLDIDPIEMY
ncbi:MAG: primosomal protein N' [Gammaproteobacteria bacterium]|nr:primosomal protein N' [Gammaproteobacteria bacterium]MCF6230423.1 primosomal protein N' [Gammaproteobacteria bacterium]